MKTLEYYFDDGSHVVFEKYMIDINGIITNKKTGKMMSTSKIGKYNVVTLQVNNGKPRTIVVGRALVSTFEGMPPQTSKHTADHIDRNPNNDILDNIHWETNKGQRSNQHRLETLKSAFIITKDNVERTAKEWFFHLKDKRNHMGRKYTERSIRDYARGKQHGFSYKEYPDLPNEVWKKIINSETSKGRWEISNMCRVKYITKYAENVLERDRLGLKNGYPKIEMGYCHIISFMTFFPEKYDTRAPGEVVLHDDDDKLDFRPHKLRLGTYTENGTDAHHNGKHDGTKTMRMKCASYINDVLEKEYLSQSDAVRYLKSVGFEKAECGSISLALEAFRNGEQIMRYGRVWRII